MSRSRLDKKNLFPDDLLTLKKFQLYLTQKKYPRRQLRCLRLNVWNEKEQFIKFTSLQCEYNFIY